jgi:CheY-like chemotaxis protein
MSANPYLVLIADDSEADRYFLKRALAEDAPRLRVIAEVQTGTETLAYLSGQGPFADRNQHPLPDLLLLDSRMPGKTGLEVLEWLQANPVPGLKVAMFADSSGMAHQTRALELGASHFFSKIVHGDELARAVKTLQAELDAGNRMKVLLHHKTTLCYLKAAGQWTPLQHEAMDFESVETAMRFARDQDLTEVLQVAVAFMGNGQIFYFPVQGTGQIPDNQV